MTGMAELRTSGEAGRRAAALRSTAEGGCRHEPAYIAERLLIGFASKRRAWARHRKANSEKDGSYA